jgi:PRTRC genetic system protein A
VFVNHIYATSEILPPFGSHLCEYVTAANGVFVRARRPGLKAMLPVCLNYHAEIRGLARVEPYIRLDAGLVPACVISQALAWMQESAPMELLTWIKTDGDYSLVRPAQSATTSRCRPLDHFDPQGQNSLLDFHSHGCHKPFFSTVDNRDEKNSFRLFAVAGSFPAPSILARVGIYAHFWNIPPEWVMELPDSVVTVCEGEPVWN